MADGRKQRRIYSREETTSSTCHNDSLVVSLLIDALECRFVSTVDVPDLHALMKDFTVLKIVGDAAESLCQADPNYKKFVTYENNKMVIYVKLKKALCGCVLSALLWYELFATTLIDMGFEINDYDPCVANKIVNDKQCTITWYVDDLKVSHVDQGVVDEIVQKINDKFGGLSVTKGKHHTYLGMGITYNEDQTVSISMNEYVEEVIDTFSNESEIISKTATPALRNLFDVDESSPKK